MTTWQDGARATLARHVDDARLAGAFALIWHDGEVVLDEAAGYRDIACDNVMARDAIFQIASMTKPVVSVAALQLVDEGKIRLGDPIAKWLPEFANPRVLNDRTGLVDRTHPAARPITVDDLLTHRAGFGYAFAETGPIAKALEPLVNNILRPTWTPSQWLANLATLPLLADPGTRFIYGHSTEILGCLIARIDGGTLGQSLERRVLSPLGMRDTAFFVPPAKLSRLAHMYRRSADGFVDVTSVPEAPPLFEAGGGGLYSTATDYLAFARMLLGQGEIDGMRLLSPRAFERMTRNQLTARQRALGGLGQADFFAHTGFGYGVHLVVEPAPPLFAGAGAMSWGGIWGTSWRLDPANRLISLLFAQDCADTSSGPDRRAPEQTTPAAQLQAEIEQAAWGALTNRNGLDEGWVHLARRRRRGDPKRLTRVRR